MLHHKPLRKCVLEQCKCFKAIVWCIAKSSCCIVHQCIIEVGAGELQYNYCPIRTIGGEWGQEIDTSSKLHPTPSSVGLWMLSVPKKCHPLNKMKNKINTFWGSWLMFGITRHTSIMKWELKLDSKSSTHCLALGWFLTNVTERREVASQGEVWAASVKGTFQWHSCL